MCNDAIDNLHNHLLNAERLWLGYISEVHIEHSSVPNQPCDMGTVSLLEREPRRPISNHVGKAEDLAGLDLGVGRRVSRLADQCRRDVSAQNAASLQESAHRVQEEPSELNDGQRHHTQVHQDHQDALQTDERR